MPDIEWIAEHTLGAERQGDLLFDPVGKCIYCEKVADHLGKEHIWPDGLGGHLILPRASCRQCEQAINAFERRVMMVNFGLVRIANRIHSKKSRKGYKRPDKIRALKDGADPVDILPSPHAPQFVMVETPGRRASLTSGIEPHPGKLVRHTGAHNLNMKMPRGYGVHVDNYSSGAFPKFLAKVAHAYACAVVGRDTFDAFLPEMIVGNADASRSRYLGDLDRLAPVDDLVRLRLGRSRTPIFTLPGVPPSDADLLLFRADIYTHLALPTFEVCVGTMRS